MDKREKQARPLRRGFTTGTCAAAGAKAAARVVFSKLAGKKQQRASSVSVSLPRGGSLAVKIKDIKASCMTASATVVKEAGDDPDVTNNADIVTEVKFLGANKSRVSVKILGGVGVGAVTRPGLKIAPGNPAINPVPLSMIRKAVSEEAAFFNVTPSVTVTVSVPKGEALAKKTLNARLGIIGGISILGTTGIVEPMSLGAYRDSIRAAIDVAAAGGLNEVVLSTGRSSELVAEKSLKLPEIAYVLTGDHMGYALKEAAKKSAFKKIIVSGQFGKFSKLAGGHFETHCSDSSVDVALLGEFCASRKVSADIVDKIRRANTAREVYFILKNAGHAEILKALCAEVKKNAVKTVANRVKITALLVGYENDVVCLC